MLICPLMSNSAGSVNCTSDCKWFDSRKGECIVFSMQAQLDELQHQTKSIEDNVADIEFYIRDK